MKKMKVLLPAMFFRDSTLFKAFVLSISLLILPGILGCAGKQVLDSVPEGVPKGYVKFYYFKSEGVIPEGSVVLINSTDNMDAPLDGPRDWAGRRVGWIDHGFFHYSALDLIKDDERGLLVAKIPGIYKILVEVKMYRKDRKEGDKWLVIPPVLSDFKILIQEGMVVPIKFNFRNVKVSASPSGRFVMEPPTIVVEEPIPFKKGESKK